MGKKKRDIGKKIGKGGNKNERGEVRVTTDIHIVRKKNVFRGGTVSRSTYL
jgi:hypothetical protein